jgi:hypothetical protein
MVKADARNHGYGSRVSWQDDYAEPALAQGKYREFHRFGARQRVNGGKKGYQTRALQAALAGNLNRRSGKFPP